MKKILFSVAMAFVLVSCSHDEVIEINRDGDEIRFGVVTDAATRAADVYCNNNLPGAFNVWATYNNATYIDGDLIQKVDNAWVNKTGVRYWPKTGNVTFYAQVNAGTAFQWNNGAPTIKDYTVDTDVTKQNDLLYAVKSQGRSDNPVTLNFRHALSQIVFQAQNTNANLYVEIKGVTICKLGNVNTFTYNSADTDENIENHNGTEGTITYNDSWGTWATLNGGNTDYAVTFTAVPVPGDGAVKSLTNTNDTDKEFSSNAMLLLPQTTTAWAPAPDNGTPEKQDGTYFLVDCKIWNVAGDAHNDSDVVLWEGPAAVPVTINWEQGKKYIYTFVFGNGNGGYDPEPGPGPDPDNPDPTPDPEPVLIPITFEVTVDDFVPVANQDIKMETIE